MDSLILDCVNVFEISVDSLMDLQMIGLAECFATRLAAEWIIRTQLRQHPRIGKKYILIELIMHNENNSSDSTPDRKN